jgi:hypothetical protein
MPQVRKFHSSRALRLDEGNPQESGDDNSLQTAYGTRLGLEGHKSNVKSVLDIIKEVENKSRSHKIELVKQLTEGDSKYADKMPVNRNNALGLLKELKEDQVSALSAINSEIAELESKHPSLRD